MKLGVDPPTIFSNLILFIIGWILISLWLNVINNFFYTYLGYSQNSLIVSFCVAMIITCFYLIYVYLFNKEETMDEQLS